VSASPPFDTWKKEVLPKHAELVDGGTSGFHLLGLFRNQQQLILIDAATDDKPLGNRVAHRPRYAKDFPPTLTAHDIGLKDLIESAALLGYWPEVDLITISIGDLGLMTMELSPEVTAALPVVEALVKCCLGKKKRRSFPPPPGRRLTAEQDNCPGCFRESRLPAGGRARFSFLFPFPLHSFQSGRAFRRRTRGGRRAAARRL